jgi:PIN domain nuclease of toxin-antitoxin system
LSQEIPARGYLLDTQAALFSMAKSRSLSTAAKAAIASGRNSLSVVSYWEVMIKTMKGKLDVGDPRIWWQDALVHLSATVLLLKPDHVAAIRRLPLIHKDPFDRALLAQAMVEGLTLVSSDAEIARYASKSLRIVG